MFEVLRRWFQMLLFSREKEELIAQNQYLYNTCQTIIQNYDVKQWSLEIPITDEMKERGSCWMCFVGAIVDGPEILLQPPNQERGPEPPLPTPDWKDLDTK